MTMTHTPLDPLDALLDGTAAELDLPQALHNAAVAYYQEVGGWLAEDAMAPTGRLLYPLGSFLLGTVVAPLQGNDFDLDFVVLEPLEKVSITQADLKARVGGALIRQLGLHRTYPAANATCSEGRRCWTLTYPGLHEDLLPSIPDREAPPTGILLTDRQLTTWQHSDPRGYAAWFEQRRQPTLVFKEARGRVETVPSWQRVKSPLQRAIQVTKRHRDLHYLENPDDRPPSILVTTLVALTYAGGSGVLDTEVHAATHMVDHVEHRGDVWWVPNPVQPLENFADKWAAHPLRANRFFDWVQALRGDLASIREELGMPKIVKRLGVYLGEGPVEKAAEAYGRSTYEQRASGLLSVAGSAATLGVGGAGSKLRDHGFYGG